MFTVKSLKFFGVENAPGLGCGLWWLIRNNLRVVKINSVFYVVLVGRFLSFYFIPRWVDFPIRPIQVGVVFREWVRSSIFIPRLSFNRAHSLEIILVKFLSEYL